METTTFANPDAFANVEAQDFAFELRPRGLEAIDEVLTQKGEELHWPATAPRLNQTVVVAPAGL